MESDAFIVDDEHSMKRLKVISRLSNITSSIENIHIDSVLYISHETKAEFFTEVYKLLKNFKKLETVVFGNRLWWDLKTSKVPLYSILLQT